MGNFKKEACERWRLGWRITSRATVGTLSESPLGDQSYVGRNEGRGFAGVDAGHRCH